MPEESTKPGSVVTTAGRGPAPHRLRFPVAGVVVALALIATAFALDAGSPAQRDAALILGSVAMYVVLPLTLIWLAVVALLRRRAR